MCVWGGDFMRLLTLPQLEICTLPPCSYSPQQVPDVLRQDLSGSFSSHCHGLHTLLAARLMCIPLLCCPFLTLQHRLSLPLSLPSLLDYLLVTLSDNLC